MNKTREEKIKIFFYKLGRKNRFYRYLVFLPIVFIVLVFSIIKYLKNNTKRLAMLGATVVLFAVYSSFSFPVFMQEEIPSVSGSDDAEKEEINYEIYLMEEAELNPDDIPLLEDDDVMDDYVDAELHGMDEADKYAIDEILEYNEDRKVSNQYRAAAKEEDTNVTFSKDDWRLILINKQHPVPENYPLKLGTIKNDMQCDERIIDDLLDMLQGAKYDGINLIICSPYRDMERQETLFMKKIKRYMNMGMSYMDAYKYASQSVTVPGASEHQIGLALDIVTDYYMNLDTGFGETEAGIWLKENCAEYGFILRYPEGKEYITGIQYEPWHFRYVGVEAAKPIMESGITLEEFLEDL